MKPLILFTIIIFLFSCNRNGTKQLKTPPEIRVVAFDSLLKKNIDVWFYKGLVFSGYIVQIEINGRIVYELPIIEGKENGVAKGIYNTGEKLMERNFINGKREGVFKQWWPNGNCRYLFNFKNDVYNGTQYVYFPDGKKQQISNYDTGELEGIQSIWDEKGQLISNYTYKNKKLYGIITAKNCMPNAH
jgi:antitoxin component YwqK of YwqJK toxin-antitoxin module